MRCAEVSWRDQATEEGHRPLQNVHLVIKTLERSLADDVVCEQLPWLKNLTGILVCLHRRRCRGSVVAIDNEVKFLSTRACAQLVERSLDLRNLVPM